MTYPQQQRPAPVYYRPVPFSGLAIAGFVLSLLWGFGFLSLIGAALAAAGIRETKRTGKRGRGLAEWGLGLGILGSLWLVYLVGTWVIGTTT
ncbi:DUF4190 domain-containing protein [Cellulomonas shaoxiangyii]|uniref:DUF4190 domain-containing protein n=1 Tax=Cellulomonas shaoxiangyii TaxID=2566013 RepID=A0A4P7SIF0_9CELL|nr:DUF4190 domain-containing protein [Cellulomonas shaoxiangyii]QCB93297.1 DUF4190 domain-containing protein [Cellulomonas shaoxiangyii]TGY82484.1 DUF4190 domain-containing protein [Cellulomonas shaoxiangyii]